MKHIYSDQHFSPYICVHVAKRSFRERDKSRSMKSETSFHVLVFVLQFSAFIMLQVKEGKGRLRPGLNADAIIKDMFNKQDQNQDGKIVEDELAPKAHKEPEQTRRDELWEGHVRCVSVGKDRWAAAVIHLSWKCV